MQKNRYPRKMNFGKHDRGEHLCLISRGGSRKGGDQQGRIEKFAYEKTADLVKS